MSYLATILVIEDDYASRVAACAILNDRGYKAIGVDNGRDGLKVAQSEGADLIVLDMNLPLMNGQQFLTARLQCERTKNIPCIITSAHAGKALIDEALQMEVDKYFIKPIDWPKLAEEIFKFCSLRRAVGLDSTTV
jgi:CheY-like chemotaxis protein